MHEMALAEGILDISLNEAKKNQATVIPENGLLVGKLSTVEPEALLFCFESIARGTIAETAELKIQNVDLVGVCNKCGARITLEHYSFLCPKCGGTLILESGRELQVEYIDME